MQVRDVMVYGAVTIEAAASVSDAAALMAKEDVGMLVVGGESKVEGVITDRDLLVRCVGEGEMPDSRSVGEYMSSPAVTIGPEVDLMDAAHMLREKNVQRMPVTQGGKLIGVISYTDIAQSFGRVMNDLMFGAGEVRHMPAAVMVGHVVHYYNHVGAAVLDLVMPLHKGDHLRLVGHTTSFKQVAGSMEIGHKPVTAAFPGDDVAMRVERRVRAGDRVYKVPE
jgi:signal-transduction protein with cAMP-binding, CBS, and nucleotidyltransferase domain